MKKISILSVCFLTGFCAVAQQSVVKEAERAMKNGTEFTKVVEIIKPALTDTETANMAQTWFIPGKAAFNQYDDLLGKKAFNKLPENGDAIMANALMGGYDYFMKALPLDSIPDAKGKVKPKYSKEIISTIGGHYNDFNSIAVEFWNLKDYKNAYKAWGIFVDLPNNPTFKKSIAIVPNDTIMCEIIYNQALAAWQCDEFEVALKAFINAKNHGYVKKNLYDYAIAVATQAGNKEAIVALAQEALPLYGKEDPAYIGQIINGYLQDKEYQKALDMINQAIAENPDNAQYYVIRGVLFEQDEVKGDAKSSYKKAVELDPQNASALYNYGRILYNEACMISDAAPADDAAYTKVYHEQIAPVLKNAVEYLEKAYDADNNNVDALKCLQNAYYILKDESNLKYTEERLAQ